MQFTRPSMEAIWPEIKKLLANDYSLIPVREKANDDWPAKSPFSGWKEFQSRRITEKELFSMMDKHYTTAVAMLCGKISGNVEAIDVDSKNKPGIDAILFQIIKELFPALWDRLRIHKSPSGGYHILYKIQEGQSVPGNKKLASRPLTEEEIKENPKAKPPCFLETRGEGGYVLVPPSMGYAVWKDTPELPIISWEDRCSLISICESLTEIIKEEPKVERAKAAPTDDSYYEINPFQDFNRSVAAESVLLNFGWTFYKSNARFIWYTRPGTVRGGIHAAFLRETRLFYFFTTNSEFEIERCYQPASVLSILNHSGDRKETYKYLVAHGFGKIRKDREERIARLSAATGRALPGNLSPEAVRIAGEAREELSRLYPWGVFWELDEEENGVRIDRVNLYRVAEKLGFRYYETLGDVVRINGNKIRTTSLRTVYDTLREYIKPESNDVRNAFESFLQKSGKFSLDSFILLDEDKILKDTKSSCFKFFEDVWIEITAYGVNEYSYDELGDRFIWEKFIQNRKFRYSDGGKYVDFLEKATGYGADADINKHVECIVGYLAHNYKDATMGYILVLTEQVEDPIHGGGSGKNIFCNLMELTTSVKTVPGVQQKFDEKFLQTWDGERVYVISDVDKRFNYINLKEPSSGKGKMKKLYKDEVIIPLQLMPKFVVITNYSYELEDGGLKRRIVPLEFTNFFTLSKGVDTYYGGMHFPNDWSDEDWAGYDGMIIRSIQTWMRSGLKFSDFFLTETGWRKQFNLAYWSMLPFIEEHVEDWLKVGYVSNDDMRKILEKYYMENSIQKKFEWSAWKLNQGLEFYCDHNKIDFVSDVAKKIKIDAGGGLTVPILTKVRVFIKKVDVAPF